MRKIFILVFLFCLSPSIVFAQFRYDMPTVCDTTAKVIQSLETNFREQLTWSGKHVNDNSVYSLWINKKDNSWTLLKMTPEFSCIIGVGDQSTIRLGDPV